MSNKTDLSVPDTTIVCIATDIQMLLNQIQAHLPVYLLVSSAHLYPDNAAVAQIYHSLAHTRLRSVCIMGPRQQANWLEDIFDGLWESTYCTDEISNMPLEDVLITVSLAYEDEDFEFEVSEMFLHGYYASEATVAQCLVWLHPQITCETQAVRKLVAQAQQQAYQIRLLCDL